MTSVAATAHGAHAHHDDRSFVQKYIFSTDHKIIGIQFLFVSLFFLLVGGLLATMTRHRCFGSVERFQPITKRY